MAHLNGKPFQPQETMTDTKTPEGGHAQRRIVETILCLAGNELMGLSTVEVQRALNLKHASVVTRDLQVLLDMGIAEKIQETGRWRLGPRMVQIARDFEVALAKATGKVRELENRYTRSSR
jgi:DNA-binding IclR family transcriptional regulator